MTGQEIRWVRETLGLSLEKFARALMVSYVTVSRWEHDRVEKMDPLHALILAAVWNDLLRGGMKSRKRKAERWARLVTDPMPMFFAAEALAVACRQRSRTAFVLGALRRTVA